MSWRVNESLWLTRCFCVNIPLYLFATAEISRVYPFKNAEELFDWDQLRQSKIHHLHLYLILCYNPKMKTRKLICDKIMDCASNFLFKHMKTDVLKFLFRHAKNKALKEYHFISPAHLCSIEKAMGKGDFAALPPAIKGLLSQSQTYTSLNTPLIFSVKYLAGHADYQVLSTIIFLRISNNPHLNKWQKWQAETYAKIISSKLSEEQMGQAFNCCVRTACSIDCKGCDKGIKESLKL